MRRSDVVFFLSGAAALVYQVVWSRLLARLLGSDAVGVALVLAVFMAGMGVGALVLADLARRARDPRRTFAAIVGVLAVWAALSPYALALLDPVASFAARAGVAVLVLLVPTALMGATFPLMGRLTIAGDLDAGRNVSGFYGANTLGASLGALLAPFVLLPALGLRNALVAGAVLDLAAGALVLRLVLPAAPPREREARSTRGAPSRVSPNGTQPSLFRPLAMVASFGAASLALEVLLTRVLVTVTGASVYAFAIVLAVFLLGLGLGSRQAAAWLSGERRALDLARRCALVTPLAGLLGLIALRWQLGENDLFGPLSNRMPKDTAPLLLWSSHALFAGLALFPPAVGFGMALPACTAVALARRGERGREAVLGRVYAVNTLGATLGSLVGGFVLLPLVGPRAGVALALGLCLVAAGFARSAESVRPWARELGLAVALCAGLGALALGGARSSGDGRVLFHVTGRDSTVTVDEAPGTAAPDTSAPVRALRVDGKVVATTAAVDLRQQRFLGIVPGLLHGAPASALVIGLGTGMTAGSLLAFPSLAELRVYEISSAVVEAAAYFGAFNEGVLTDPRTRIEIVDGRHALALDARRYDVVTSDPIHPWTRGSSNLYALEHFQRMAARLAPGGVASQWLPLYQLGTEDVETVIATWCAAFPHVSAWLTAYDLVLVGASEPIDAQRLGSIALPERVGTLLGEAGVHSGLELAALEIAGDDALRARAAGTSPMTEDRPRLEYRAPLAFLSGYSVEVLAWAARRPPPAHLPPNVRERAVVVRGLLEDFLAELPSGLSSAAEHYGRELLALEPLSSP